MIRNGFFSIVFVCCCLTVSSQQSEWRNLIEKKQFEKVILQLDELQPADSADFEKMYLIGQAYEGLLKYKDAYNFYKQCFLLDSSRMDMLNTLARISVNLGKAKEAEKYYQMVLEVDSANFYANFQLARLYVSVERYEEGLGYYDYLLESDSDNVSILWAMGDCYTRMGDLQLAYTYYFFAFNLNRENATLANSLINTLLKIDPGSSDVAMAYCDTALYYNPGHKALRQQKAMIYYLKKEYSNADSIYTELIDEGDNSYNTLKYCGCARYQKHKWYLAIEPLEVAYEMDPTAYDVCILLGICIGRAYDPGQALAYFDKAEKLMQPDSLWSNSLEGFRGEIYLKTGNRNKGAETYYRIWMKDKQQINLLQQIQRSYYVSNLEQLSEDDRQRYLFITFLYVSELFEHQDFEEMRRQNAPHLRSVLKKYEEEMFMRNLTNYPMLSPDNKRNALPVEKLKELIGKLSVFP